MDLKNLTDFNFIVLYDHSDSIYMGKLIWNVFAKSLTNGIEFGIHIFTFEFIRFVGFAWYCLNIKAIYHYVSISYELPQSYFAKSSEAFDIHFP